jgi:LytS/YehU family sensor histidine kinase
VLAQLLPAGDPVRPSLADGIRFSLAINFQTAVMTYWAITGAVYAYGFHRREVELRATAADEQWKTLESHLAPHFLFNALGSVTALVDDDPRAAKRLVAQLGDLLRQSLAARERHTLTLDEELESVTRYLDVEQARFADRLVVAIEADAGARRCQIPAFLLQPLVENAIQHCLQPSLEPVTIAVRARVDHDRLTVEISDDAAPVERTPGHGFGLERTRARLDRLYGPAHRFDAASAARGFRVDIEIPATEQRP